MCLNDASTQVVEEKEEKEESKVEFIDKHYELNLMMLLWFFYVIEQH